RDGGSPSTSSWTWVNSRSRPTIPGPLHPSLPLSQTTSAPPAWPAKIRGFGNCAISVAGLRSIAMQEYLLELYISRTDPRVIAARGESARAAAIELTRRGTPVRYRRSIFLPDEETCFVLFEA